MSIVQGAHVSARVRALIGLIALAWSGVAACGRDRDSPAHEEHAPAAAPTDATAPNATTANATASDAGVIAAQATPDAGIDLPAPIAGAVFGAHDRIHVAPGQHFTVELRAPSACDLSVVLPQDYVDLDGHVVAKPPIAMAAPIERGDEVAGSDQRVFRVHLQVRRGGNYVMPWKCRGLANAGDTPGPSIHADLHARGADCPKTCDLSTDEKLAQAYFAETGANDARDAGRKPVTGVPSLVEVTAGRAGKDPIVTGSFYRCCYYDGARDDARLQRTALADLGWATADAAGRERLALRWAEDVVGSVVPLAESAAPEFTAAAGARTFAAPHAASTPDGGVVVTAWQRGRKDIGLYDMGAWMEYRALEIRFAPDGAVTTTIKDRFDIDAGPRQH
jgi:hypothetical protein